MDTCINWKECPASFQSYYPSEMLVVEMYIFRESKYQQPRAIPRRICWHRRIGSYILLTWIMIEIITFFPLPEIIDNPSLIFSLYAYLDPRWNNVENLSCKISEANAPLMWVMTRMSRWIDTRPRRLHDDEKVSLNEHLEYREARSWLSSRIWNPTPQMQSRLGRLRGKRHLINWKPGTHSPETTLTVSRYWTSTLCRASMIRKQERLFGPRL